MKQHLILGAVGVLALGPAVVTAQASAADAAPRAASTPKTSQSVGRTVSYKGSKLRVMVGKRRIDYAVNKATMCGYSRGNRGTGIRCSQLAQKRYLAKPVRVMWYTDAKKRRVATIVAVILSR